ncbi:MAG TPA: PP2C family protein-serine/threonine phosphatase [Solirubrobacteraceae bacterium]|nr:PP2C family protein-serine/threonine phosphatase [Solirubrobacteraceae bacterium]
MAVALLLALIVLFATVAPVAGETTHGRSGVTGSTGNTPVTTDPYAEGGEGQGTQTTEAEAAPSSAGAPASSGSSSQPATGGAQGSGKPSDAAGKGGKVKHAPKREPKGKGRTPEAPAAAIAPSTGSPPVQGTSAQTVDVTPAAVASSTSVTSAPSHTGGGVKGGSGARVHTRAHRHRAGARRGHHRAARGSAARRGAPASGALAARALGTGTPSTGSARTGARHGGQSKPAPTRSAPARESPIVRSVTRLVNVVPPLIRVLIAALVALALLLAVRARMSAARARRLVRQREELLDDVGLLQGALLPPLPARIGPVGTSAAYQPASGPGAGGDFYDVFALGDGRIAVILGDVSGHGRDALPQTTLLRFTLRAYLEAGLSPRSALATAGPVLERQLGSSFATVVLATYDPRERTLVYSCAGHPPPIVLGSDSASPITASSAPPIGVGAPTGTRQTTISIPGSALVCFYTDGVVEARAGGALFGSSRLQRVLATIPSEADAEQLLERIGTETDKRPDDMAACMLRVEGEPFAPRVRVEEIELDQRELERDRAARFLRSAGVHPAEVAEVIAELRREIARHGRVVLTLHLGDGEPEVVLSPQNIATLQPTIRAASAQGALS